MAQLYVTEKLGPRRGLTSEGYLVCFDVPVARTGVMMYVQDEIQPGEGEEVLKPDSDGIIYVTREPDEVFRPETLDSFESKPVTIDHPDGLVTPETWRDVAVGTMRNVRRGADIQDNLVLADLLLTDPEAIELVDQHKLNEVSLGYDAQYQQIKPGYARQFNIVGNHIALVEQGRCGPQCTIGDKQMNIAVRKKSTGSWRDRIRKAFWTRDEEAMNKALEEGGEHAPYMEKESEGMEKTAPTDEGNMHHHVTVNINGLPQTGDIPGSPGEAGDAGGTGAPGEQGTGGPGGGEAGMGQGPSPETDPVGAIMAMFKKIDERLTVVEQRMGGAGAAPAPHPAPGGALPAGAAPAPHPAPGGAPPAGAAPGAAAKPPGAGGAEAPEKPEKKEGSTGDDVGGADLRGEAGGEESIAPLNKDPNPAATGTSPSEGINSKSGQGPSRTGDAQYRTSVNDAAREREEFTDTLARAEALLPGLKLPTFDAKRTSQQTKDSLCVLKRRALNSSFATDRGEQIIRPFIEGPELKLAGMSCEAVAILFRAASNAAMDKNRGYTIDSKRAEVPKKPQTPAELNSYYRDYYAKQSCGR